MKTATAREVQHHFNRVLQWVNENEEVMITKHNKTVAILVAPHKDPAKPEPVDFYNRAKQTWGSEQTTLSDIIIQDRKERI